MATHSSILALRNPMDRETWRAAVHGVAKSWMRLKQFGKQNLNIPQDWLEKGRL